MFGRHDLYLVCSSSLLLFLSLPPFSFWPLAFLALAPFIVFLSRAGFSKKAFFGSYIFGFVFLLLQYSFLFDLLPLDWIGLTSSFSSLAAVLFFWFSLSAVLSFSFIFFPFLFHPRLRKVLAASYLPYILFPLLWPASEILRSFLYSVLTFGPGGTLGNHFAFGYLAYAASNSSLLLFLSPHLGLYGLSFFFSFFASLIAFCWNQFPNKRKISLFVFLFCLLLYVAPIGPKKPTSQEINILAIQANNPVVFGYDEGYFRKAANAFTQSITEGLSRYPDTDIVLLSENSGFFDAYAKSQNLSPEEAIKKLLGKEKKRFLVFGAYDEKLIRETTRVISNQGPFDEKSLTKEVLMPIGEYQPYLFGFLARLLGRGDWFHNLSIVRGAAALTDSKREKYFDSPFGRVAVLACSEILSQKAYGLVKETKPVLILHQQRLAPFHDGKAMFKNFLAASRLRAAMLRTPIAGSLDGGGFSYIIDSAGQVVSLGVAESAFIYARVGVEKQP